MEGGKESSKAFLKLSLRKYSFPEKYFPSKQTEPRRPVANSDNL